MTATSGTDDRRRTAMALLAFYREAGIDAFVGETPRDRFAETRAEAAQRSGGDPGTRPAARARSDLRENSQAARPAAARPVSPPHSPEPQRAGDPFPSPALASSGDVAVADARERARSAATLAELRMALESFDGCGLKVTAKSCVFGNGSESARLMMIGEAPGREEDLAGEPFVGRSGRLLDQMLAAIGVARADVRVTNTVPWRPPGNRPPTPAETEACLPFVQRQIELVRPDILVCLGSPSAKAILGASEGILRIRGRWTTYAYGVEPGETIAATAMLHPAYLLRQPAQKRLAWRDLLAVAARLSPPATD